MFNDRQEEDEEEEEDDDNDVPEAYGASTGSGEGGHSDARFRAAVELVNSLPQSTTVTPGGGGPGSLQLQTDEKLKMYGLYKQATEGDVTGSRPPFYDYVARAKWDAWNSTKGMYSDDAKSAYADAFVEFLQRYKEHPHVRTCLQSMQDLDRNHDVGQRWSGTRNSEGVMREAQSPPTRHSPLSTVTDNDAYLSTEEFNVALAAREAAEEAERASSISEAGGAVFMPPPAIDWASPQAKGISPAITPVPPLTAYPGYGSPRVPMPPPVTSAPNYSADSHYRPAGGVSYVQPQQPQQSQVPPVSYSGPLPSSATMTSLGPSTRKFEAQYSGMLSEEAEMALQALQTEVAALNERIEILKRELVQREKKKAKRGIWWLMKLVIRHALVNSVLLFVVIAYFYYRRSPFALGVLAELLPRVVQTYRRGRQAVTGTRREVVDRGRDVVNNVRGTLHEMTS